MGELALNHTKTKRNGNGKRPYSSILHHPQLSYFSHIEFTSTRISKITNQFGEDVTQVDGEIPVSLEVKDGQRFLFISYDQSALTHGLHTYPAKFFPELPRWLINKYSEPGDWVLDPFAGSATVNLECLLARRHSVALDIDLFSRFLAKVKVTPLDIAGLKAAYNWLVERVAQYGYYTPSQEQWPNFPYRDNWFHSYILGELTYLKQLVLALPSEPLHSMYEAEARKIADFFLICLSSIIRGVSNADDNCTRTVIRKKLNKQVRPGDALIRFQQAIDTNVPKMMEFSAMCPRDVTVEIPDNSDARKINYPENSFDLAVTSPPYVNAVDYPRTHQLEMYWLGIAEGSLTPLKKLHIGTESVNHKDYQMKRSLGILEADRVIEQIYEKDPRRAFILYKYLEDMGKTLDEVWRVLKPGARYAIVVGNNRMRGCLVETWKYLWALAERTGFQVDSYLASEIIRHFIKVPREERIQTDCVLILYK